MENQVIKNNHFDYNDMLQFNILQQGVIRLTGEIFEHESTVVKEINYILTNTNRKEITLIINSPGGSISGAFALYDYLISCGLRIIVKVEGIAASAASMIVLQAADERLSYPNSRFLLHEPRLFSFFEVQKTTDTQDRAKEMAILSEMVYDVLSARCNKTKKELKKLIERREVWMSAKEALEFNLIDEII